MEGNLNFRCLGDIDEGVAVEWFHCSYNNWCAEYGDFIYDYIIVPIPNDVLSYLMSDVMVLPKNSLFNHRSNVNNGFWSATDEELEEPNFFEFDEKLKEAISHLGGKVFVKLNWSAPKDASWITSTRSLCCSDPADIYLLLKSSTHISNDLSLIKKDSVSPPEIPCCLVFKKWEEIHPGTEYRCFVINKNLAGICQRDTTSYFKHICDSRESIAKTITDFFQNCVKKKFPLGCYTFDIVVSSGNHVILVDFGVLNKDTDFLLFSWKEFQRKKKPICSEEELKTSSRQSESQSSCVGKVCDDIKGTCNKPEFRIIDELTNVTQSQCKHYGIPVDAMYFCSGRKNVADFIREEILNHTPE